MNMIVLLTSIATFSLCAQACPPCPSCIPLERLLSPAYGIEIAVDGMSSAVAFHNGTMNYIGLHTATPAFRTTMQTIADNYRDQPPQYRRSSCYSEQPIPSPWQFPFVQEVSHYFSNLWDGEEQQLAIENSSPPVNPNILLFQAEMEALAPFVNMSSEQRSKAFVALTFPGWLTGTKELCQIGDAAARTFGEIFAADHPSASFTAMGYDLCRTPTDLYECNGPGYLTTIDFQENDLISITLTRTPIMSFLQFEAIYALSSGGKNYSELVKWIDSFISLNSSTTDMVLVTGPGASKLYSQQAIQHSKARVLLIHQSSIPADKVAAMGAAQFAKDSLERRFDGCWETDECEDIRREADYIAGKFNPPAIPST